MNNQLKVICILFAIAYLFFVGKAIYYEILDKADFYEGLEAGKKGQTDTYSYEFVPSSGKYLYPHTAVNQLTGQLVKLEPKTMLVKVEKLPIQLPAWLSFCRKTGNFLAGFIVGIILIFLPFQTFRVVRSMVNNEIFDQVNIARIKKIGYALLAYFAFHSFATIIENLSTERMIAFEGYDFKGDFDATFLIFGLAVWMFAEVLKIAFKIKEENDLTV